MNTETPNVDYLYRCILEKLPTYPTPKAVYLGDDEWCHFLGTPRLAWSSIGLEEDHKHGVTLCGLPVYRVNAKRYFRVV